MREPFKSIRSLNTSIPTRNNLSKVSKGPFFVAFFAKILARTEAWPHWFAFGRLLYSMGQAIMAIFSYLLVLAFLINVAPMTRASALKYGRVFALIIFAGSYAYHYYLYSKTRRENNATKRQRYD